MIRRRSGRPLWLLASAVVAFLACALPAAAQGVIRGTVRDGQGQPVDGAKVLIEFTEGSRKFETKTDKKGEFVQIGLASGAYRVAVEKEKVGGATENVRVRAAAPVVLNMVLAAGMTAGGREEAAKADAIRKVFQEGAAAGRAGNYDEVIAKFTTAVQMKPDCAECYINIGTAHLQKKEYDKAEAALKKSIEIKENADAYSALANVYNAQRKFEEAAAAANKATQLGGGGATAGGGNADALFNQGVILWNAGKVADAKKQFQAALQADPNHAESHYQLAMTLVNEGNLAGAATEFETYVKLVPEGPNAAQAKALLAQLKK